MNKFIISLMICLSVMRLSAMENQDVVVAPDDITKTIIFFKTVEQQLLEEPEDDSAKKELNKKLRDAVPELLKIKKQKKLILKQQPRLVAEFEKTIKELQSQIKELKISVEVQSSSLDFQELQKKGLSKRLKTMPARGSLSPSDRDSSYESDVELVVKDPLVTDVQATRENYEERMGQLTVIADALKAHIKTLLDQKQVKLGNYGDLNAKLTALQRLYGINQDKLYKIHYLIIAIEKKVPGSVDPTLVKQSEGFIELVDNEEQETEGTSLLRWVKSCWVQ